MEVHVCLGNDDSMVENSEMGGKRSFTFTLLEKWSVLGDGGKSVFTFKVKYAGGWGEKCVRIQGEHTSGEVKCAGGWGEKVFGVL